MRGVLIPTVRVRLGASCSHHAGRGRVCVQEEGSERTTSEPSVSSTGREQVGPATGGGHGSHLHPYRDAGAEGKVRIMS